MRLFISLSAAIVIAAVALTACNSTDTNNGTAKSRNGSLANAPLTPSGQKPSATPVHGDGIKRVTKDELREAVDKGTAIIVDVRPAQSYQQSHIKGAIHIPLEQVSARIGELPRDKMIVTYCSWPAEQTSARAALDMKAKGLENVAALYGGTAAWQNAGLPMQTGNTP